MTSQCPLTGLQVLDLTSGPAGGLASMILADFGAAVTRFADPQYAYLNDEPAARMWLRGKACSPDQEDQEDKEVLADSAGELASAVSAADILLISHPHGFASVDFERCVRSNPRLIYCEITGAGEGSNLPPYEAVIAARAGRMQSMAGIIPGAGPHYAAVPVATHATAQNVVSGVLAALFKRLHGGCGQRLSTSLLQGLMPYDQAQSLLLQVRPDHQPPDPASLMPTLNYHPVQCADGKWLQLGNLLPHLFESFMRVLGLQDLLAELPDNLESVRSRILETMQTRTRDEWMSLFVADGGIAAHPYLSAAEALQDPDMTLNGHVVELNGVTQLGPLARLTETPALVTADAKPTTDEYCGFNWAGAEQATDSNRLPLEGVKVLELATIIAAPLGASFLADMGARVIKVEAIAGDPFRGMLGGLGAVRCNQGKESICVDLKTAEGQQIVRRLAIDADILIHNYRPGVPERLGIAYGDLRKINPGLVYLSANGYGPDGPGALRPSTHPIPGAAMGGAGYQAGGTIDELLPIDEVREAARKLMRANEVNPDPNTAVVICSSALLGLIAREVSGCGQEIFVDMFIANAYANFDDMVDYSDKPERPSLGESLKGPHPLHRLYAAKEGWVFLGLKCDSRHQREWRTFCSIVGWDEHSAEPLDGDDRALENKLADLFRSHTAEHWEQLMVAQGLGCVRADRGNMGEFFLQHCREDSALMVRVQHEELGAYYRHAPMIDFDGVCLAPAAGVRAGVDGAQLLRELGYAAEDIEGLFGRGVISSSDRRSDDRRSDDRRSDDRRSDDRSQSGRHSDDRA